MKRRRCPRPACGRAGRGRPVARPDGRHAGAEVIGTAGSPEKAGIAAAAGCAYPVFYREVDFAEEVMTITKGRGVQIVYDSTGADTFARFLQALAPCGHLVNLGQSSGNVEPVAMNALAHKSLTDCRPILFHYLADALTYQDMAARLFCDSKVACSAPMRRIALPLPNKVPHTAFWPHGRRRQRSC